MSNPLFNRRHLLEYAFFGTLAALVFCIPVWIYLRSADYGMGWVVYGGPSFFMFIILLYGIRLNNRRADYKSTWKMIMAGHLAVFTGIAVSVILCFILCFVYIPGFMSGNSDDSFLQNAPAWSNQNNAGTIFQIFFPATLENFGAGSLMALVAAYALKKNQTNDKTAPL